MPKTRRKKINGKAPMARNCRLVLLQEGEMRKPHNRSVTVRVFTGQPRSKAYPYGSARQGYAPAPRVEHRERPVLTVDDSASASAPR